MATKVKKLTDELAAPTLPGTVSKNAVKTAAAGVQNARNAVTNMTYDNFKSGDLYKGLQRDYQQRGQQAMKDTLGQVAARTGGMASSYATSAANQSYNNYMLALEEAARNQFNEEYARKRDDYDMALREYDTAYGEYRDQVGDAWTKYNAEMSAYQDKRNYNYQLEQDQKAERKATEKEAQDVVMAIWANGGIPSEQQLKAAGWTDPTTQNAMKSSAQAESKQDYIKTITENAAAGIVQTYDPNNLWGISEEEFNNAVSVGDAEYKGSAAYLAGQDATDETIKAMITGEDFDWNEYDWNQDGTVDENDENAAQAYFDSKDSAYDADYWMNIYNNAQSGYADEATKESQTAAVNDISARIANGESLEDIATEYDIDGESTTWESVTGMSEAEWQQIQKEQTDATLKQVISSHTPESIARRFVADLSNISENEKAALDYYFGAGTTEAAAAFVTSAGFKASMTDLGEDHHQAQHVKEFYKLLPDNIPDEIIYPYIERYYPNAFNNLRKYSREE